MGFIRHCRCAVLLTAIAVSLSSILSCSCSDNPTEPPPSTPSPQQNIDVSPAWSPGDQWVAFNRGTSPLGPAGWGLYKIRSDGTGETRILEYPTSGVILSVEWNDQDWILVTTYDLGVYKVRPDGSSQTVLFDEYTIYASWSPDGSQIVFGPAFQALWIMDSAGQNARLLDPADSVFRGTQQFPEWGKDGLILHVRYTDRLPQPKIVKVDPVSLALTVVDSAGDFSEVGGLKYISPQAFAYFRIGTLEIHPQIYIVDSPFAEQRCLTCGDERNTGGKRFDISHLSGRVVYTNTRHGGLDIMDADGSNRRQLTFPEGAEP